MKSTFLLSCFSFLLFSCKQNSEATLNQSSLDEQIKNEIQSTYENHILSQWYPLTIDTSYGGFLTDFDYAWTKKGKQNKMIVTQARHLWTLSKAIDADPHNPLYKEAALHGFKHLRDVMWDSEHGGFYNMIEQNGKVIPDHNSGEVMKLAYGNSFAIYGLAAYYKASGNTESLELAKEGFHWLEQHSHDPEDKGYFQFMDNSGTALKTKYGVTPPKDQNSSIHLMEAFTELYLVWEDDLLRERLEEIMVLIRDEMTEERGYLNLFFQRDWTPQSYRDSTAEVRSANYNLDHVSFGHDIETAWLLMEASKALYGNIDSKTKSVAKVMVDHGLNKGYDAKVGGVYDRGYYFKDKEDIEIIKDGKNWWTQVETLNTLLYMSQLYPEDQMEYRSKFKQQWDYIKNYLIDQKHGGFYTGGIDKEPKQKQSAKSQIWKGPYHTARALKNCADMLSTELN